MNVIKFSQFCCETADMYVSLYPWYAMPPSVHTILLHCRDVLQNMILPIGMMSEEAQESLNKYVMAYRLHHTRKDSREHTMSDQFRCILVTSDPMISLQRFKRQGRAILVKKSLLPETIALLQQCSVMLSPAASGANSSTDSDDSSDC